MTDTPKIERGVPLPHGAGSRMRNAIWAKALEMKCVTRREGDNLRVWRTA